MELERPGQCPVICSRLVARESKEANEIIARVQAPVGAQGTPAVSEEQHGSSLTEEMSEVSMEFETTVIIQK